MKSLKACRMVLTAVVPEGESQDDLRKRMARICAHYAQGLSEEGMLLVESYAENVTDAKTLRHAKKYLKENY